MSTPNHSLSYSTRILGTGSAFPQNIVTNHDLAKTLDTNDEWIRERTGIRERRVSKYENPQDQNSSLGAAASLRALEMAGRKIEDIDAIFYATCTPDTLLPSTACWVQKKLGATRAWGIDLNAACSGFVYGLATADAFIRSGQIKTALVIGGEVTTAKVDWTDRTSCILFGDGAGAAVVERTTAQDHRRVISHKLHTDGSLWEYFYIEAGGTLIDLTPEVLAQKRDKMRMKGKEIFKVAVKTLADFAMQTLEEQGMTLKDLDWFIPHQANLRIIEAVAKRIDLPMEKLVLNIDRFGNTSAATVPTALDEAIRDGRIKPGHLVLMDVFGAGLTYGTSLVRM